MESDVFGFWAFLMSDALIFALLFAIYATMIGRYAGGPTPGQEFKFHSAFWETALLLTSSFTYGGVSIALKHDAKRRWIVLFMAITFCLGAYFVRMECHEFTTMFHDGATPEHSGYLSSFFVLVAMLPLLNHIIGGHIGSIDGGPRSFQPMNVNFGLFPPLATAVKGKDGERLRGAEKTLARKRALTRRALVDLDHWIEGDGHAAAAE